jgi:histidine triad (HIT) family protein
VLVDRPGRGYGDDYSPWLVDAPVGELVGCGRARSPTRGSWPHDGSRLHLLQDPRGELPATWSTGRRALAIEDINPKADVHLLVIPERHIADFREIGVLSADESQAHARFVAETARRRGLEEYRLMIFCGAGAGQTVFHLHWHVLGGHVQGMPA